MKKPVIFLLGALFGILFLYGCKHEELNDKVSCRINGEKYYSYYYRKMFARIDVSYYVEQNEFDIRAEMRKDIKESGYDFRFFVRPDSGRIYPDRYITDTVTYSTFVDGSGNRFVADSGSAWIEFQWYDPDKKGIIARFGGTYYDDNGEVLEVTDGKIVLVND